MTSVLAPLLVLACLVGIFGFMFRGIGGNVGRPPSGILTRLKSPTDAPLTSAALAGLALGVATARTDPDASSQSGVLIGLTLAVVLAIPAIQHLSIAACGVVGVLLAFWDAQRFIAGEGLFDPLSMVYRLSLMLLVFAAFVLGTLLFGRASALRVERGLALFALVEITTFLAQPAGRDVFGLDPVSHATYLLIACGIAFAAGWAASQYVLGILSIGVALTVWAQNAVIGDAQASWIGLVAAASAVALTFVASRLVRWG